VTAPAAGVITIAVVSISMKNRKALAASIAILLIFATALAVSL
jgi:hypothetical protein